MTPSAREQAVLTGAVIVVLTKNLCRTARARASVIRLVQRIAGINKKQPKKLAILADHAYNAIKNKYVDEKIELDIGILISSLAYSKELYLRQLYGNEIMNLVDRASDKVTLPGLTIKQGVDTYRIADELIASIEKTVFENKD